MIATNIYELSYPDLSYTSLDGLVDFGLTKLEITINRDGDELKSYLKGKMAIKGGICPGAECHLQILQVELESLKEHFVTAKGKNVTNLFTRNLNIWTGKKLSDGTIQFDPGSKLGLQARVSGNEYSASLNPGSMINGKIIFNAPRLTDSISAVNNRIDVKGNFSDEDITLNLNIAFWMTDCRPVATPKATCRPNIESGLPGHVEFSSTFDRLENMKYSQDLCDALKSPDYTKVCRAGGTVEFPTFSCDKKSDPPTTNPFETAKHLEFTWLDANGRLLSKEFNFNMDRIPIFPITLNVKNEFKKIIKETIQDAPVCTSDVPLEPGACAWEKVFDGGHQPNNWCPEGTFLTAIDLDSDHHHSSFDEPFVGAARCCAPNASKLDWASCSWNPIGIKSHQKYGSWCAENKFLTCLDFDSDTSLDAHDSPIVGQAGCCALADMAPSGTQQCYWVEIGDLSHKRSGGWCKPGFFLAAMDLDGDRNMSAYDAPVVGRSFCCPLTMPQGSAVMEYETNRGGKDYKSFELNQANPAQCLTACDKDQTCKAWTYVKPGVQGTKARCWLKNDIPEARLDSCCVSGVKGREYNMDRKGSDFRSFELEIADPNFCQKACDDEIKCKAWTYVKPGVQGEKARCWLKNSIPSVEPDFCCVSGVK